MATAVGDLVVNLAANTKPFEQGMNRSRKNLDRLSRSMNDNKRASNSSVRGLLELSRGAEDAAVGFGTTGLSGAIRGSLNNLTQFAFIVGGPVVAAVAGFAAAGLSMIPVFAKMNEGLNKTKSEAEKLKEAMDSVKKSADAAGQRAGLLFDLGSEKTPFGRFKKAQGQLRSAERALKVGSASSQEEIDKIRRAQGRAAQDAFDKSFSEGRFGTLFGLLPGGSSAQNPTEAKKRIKEIGKLLKRSDIPAREASSLIGEREHLLAALKAAEAAAAPFAEKITEASVGMQSLRRNVTEARKELQKAGQELKPVAAERPELKPTPRFAVAAVKPDVFKEERRAAKQIKESIKSPIQRILERAQSAKRLRDLGLLTQGQFAAFGAQLSKQAGGLLPKNLAPQDRNAGALEAGSTGALTAIVNAARGKSANQTAANTKDIKKTNEQIKKGIDDIKKIFGQGADAKIVGGFKN